MGGENCFLVCNLAKPQIGAETIKPSNAARGTLWHGFNTIHMPKYLRLIYNEDNLEYFSFSTGS